MKIGKQVCVETNERQHHNPCGPASTQGIAEWAISNPGQIDSFWPKCLPFPYQWGKLRTPLDRGNRASHPWMARIRKHFHRCRNCRNCRRPTVLRSWRTYLVRDRRHFLKRPMGPVFTRLPRFCRSAPNFSRSACKAVSGFRYSFQTPLRRATNSSIRS